MTYVHNSDDNEIDDSNRTVTYCVIGAIVSLALMFFFGYQAGSANRSNCEVSAQANGIQYTVCTKEIK
jgi:hypothetical protein